MMLPTVLLLVDDFETDHVVNGLQMMNKIFNETPAAELRYVQKFCLWFTKLGYVLKIISCRVSVLYDKS